MLAQEFTPPQRLEIPICGSLKGKTSLCETVGRFHGNTDGVGDRSLRQWARGGAPAKVPSKAKTYPSLKSDFHSPPEKTREKKKTDF